MTANAIDSSTYLAATVLIVVASAAFYVWIALGLAAVFRKSGEEAWKGWVPVLNVVVLLRLGGYSGWLALLLLVPVAGWVVIVLACHRVGAAFGFGAGMTVVAALLFPVWASIVGFGSSRWVGRETGSGVRRSTGGDAPIDERTAPPASIEPFAGGPAYSPIAPPPAYGRPSPAPSFGTGQAGAPSPQGSAPLSGWGPPPRPGQPITATPFSSVPEKPPLPAANPVDVPRPAAPASAAGEGWKSFGPGAVDELTGEVTGAISGAPAPIAAVPATPGRIEVPPTSPSPRRTAGPVDTVDDDTAGSMPPVTRVPSAAAPADDREPWAPARSPMSDPEAFPETSGPVSAIAGAPDAGAPRSARASVSAQHVLPEIPDDVIEETIIARRKQTQWSLVLPSGEPVALGSEVVILGRRPAPDADFPGAQLIAIQDGTVSKTHARLVLRDDTWWVTDLGSTNGVLFATVLGTEVEATPGEECEAGDRFLLGDAEVRLLRSDA